MKAKHIIILTSIVCVTILLITVFFWPGIYRYERVEDGNLIRVNRITGQTEHYFDLVGWVNIGEDKGKAENPVPVPVPLPRDAIAKITAKANFDSIGYLVLDVYNQSDWIIWAITVHVIVKDKQNEVMEEGTFDCDIGDYFLHNIHIIPSSTGHPKSRRQVISSLKFNDIGSWTWNFVEVKGLKSES